jgi:hypothetical protein
MYALAASAAGVGALALTQPAQAKIVYTPANVDIPINGGLVQLDLNHDGINDFDFSNVYHSYTRRGSHLHNSYLNVSPEQTGNKVLRFLSDRKVWGAALPKGAPIGLSKPFQPGNNKLPMVEGLDNWSYKGTYGPWIDKRATYLGLEFLIEGKIHFGWARLTVSINSGDCKGICATLTGYAYETVPAKAIVAGKTKGGAGEDQAAEPTPASAFSPGSAPASLGRLAQGHMGLAAWRTRDPGGE